MKLDSIYCLYSEGILKDINFTFTNNKLYYIVVPDEKIANRLFELITLMTPIMEGKFYINDLEVSTFSYKKKTILRRENMGLLFKDILLDKDLTIYENVLLPLLNIKTNNKKEKVNALLDRYKLSKVSNYYPSDLSLYQKQLTSLARALINNPQFIIALMPTDLMTKNNEEKFYKELKNISHDRGVIIITKRVKYQNLADEIIFYENKRL